MADLPEPGTRVSVRYRLPPGSQPPMSDVVGHLVETGPLVKVRAKDGAVAQFSRDDVVTVRVLTAVPVRNSQIRAVEHAAALAWPGREHGWLDGWLLRAGDGSSWQAGSAVPLQMHARLETLPDIVSWYEQRGLPPWLALPDRLVRTPTGLQPELEARVLVAPLADIAPAALDGPNITFAAQPDERWLRVHQRETPVEVLTAVVDGEVVFASLDGQAVGRAAVTAAPDDTRWVGLSEVRVTDGQRRRGLARRLCRALLTWGVQRGAGHAYVQVPADNTAALALAEAVGLSEQHRLRYFDARQVLERRV